MKTKSQQIFLIALTILFSCNNEKKGSSDEKENSSNRIKTPTEVSGTIGSVQDSAKIKKHNDAFGNNSYFFSNDSICQNLIIKEKSKNRKLDIPEKIEFKLILHNKKQKTDDKTFEGVAELFSSEESFFDNSEKNGTFYDAVDYNLETTDYQIKIRLDIENYDACVVSIMSKQSDKVLGWYGPYLKKFPNEGIMKIGKCK